MKGKIVNSLPVFLFEEGNKIVAWSPAIDLSTCGDTEEQARKMFVEAAKIFFDEIIEMGTIDDVLTEYGWKRATPKHSWSPPEYKQESVLIPEGV